MVTNRTPRRPSGKFRITPRAVEIFDHLQTADEDGCGCYLMLNTKCTVCIDRLYLEQELRAELGLTKPYQFPTLVHPDEACPCTPNSGGAIWWPTAQDVYRALAEAAGYELR